MKKLLLTGAFALASFLTAQAQSILTEGFEDADTVFPSDNTGWAALDIDGDAASFGVYLENASITALGFTGQVAGSGNFTVSGSNATLSPDTDNVFWSPFFILPEGASAVSIKFASAPLEADATAPYEIYILSSDDAATLGAATSAEEFATALNALTPAASGTAPAAAAVVSVDLSSLAGDQAASFIIRHRNTNGGAYLFLDDVNVYEGTAGVKEIVGSQFGVFPNPANDVVNVISKQNNLVNNVSIVDINGRTVKSVKFDGVANAAVNVSDLAKGVYVMTISSDKGATTQKIVKN